MFNITDGSSGGGNGLASYLRGDDNYFNFNMRYQDFLDGTEQKVLVMGYVRSPFILRKSSVTAKGAGFIAIPDVGGIRLEQLRAGQPVGHIDFDFQDTGQILRPPIEPLVIGKDSGSAAKASIGGLEVAVTAVDNTGETNYLSVTGSTNVGDNSVGIRAIKSSRSEGTSLDAAGWDSNLRIFIGTADDAKHGAVVNLGSDHNPFTNWKIKNYNYSLYITDRPGNIPPGTVYEVTGAIKDNFEDKWHINSSDIQEYVVQAGGGFSGALSAARLTDMVRRTDTDTLSELAELQSKSLYRLKGQTSWRELYHSTTIANKEGNGDITATTADIAVRSLIRYTVETSPTLKGIDESLGLNVTGTGSRLYSSSVPGAELSNYRAKIASNIFTLYPNYEHTGNRPYRGNELYDGDAGVAVDISWNTVPNATGYNVYIKYEYKWRKVYTGNNTKFTWLGQVLSTVNPPTSNGTGTYQGSNVAVPNITEDLDVRVGDSLIVYNYTSARLQQDFGFSLPVNE